MRPALLLAALLIPVLAAAAPVSLKAADGATVVAHESGQGTKGVLLLHDAGRSANDWTLVRTRLEDKGYRVLALDLRGHGESVALLGATEPDWAAMTQDVQAAVARLRKQGAKSITIIGAGLGANLAMAHAAADPAIESLVLLSPGLNIKGYRPSQTVQLVAERPILLAAGEGDSMAVNTVKYLNNQVKGKKRMVVLPGDRAGATLLDEHPALEDQVFAWLAGRYDDGGEGMENGGVRAGDADSVESQGKRFGE